jgi:hypothetical protein
MAGINGALDAFFNFETSAGVFAGWSQRIHCSLFQLDTPSELQELLSKGRDDFNQVVGSVANPQPSSFNFTLRGAELEMFRMTWLASQATFSQSSGNVTDEVVNVKSGTKRFKVVGRDISAPVVTSSPAGTTYVLGTDYVLTNARLGIFDVVVGSSLDTAVTGAGAAGLNLLVDYAKAAISGGIQMKGAASPNIIAQVIGDGVNRSNLKPFDIFVPRAIIAPQGGIDLLAEGFAEAQFQARMVTVAPYTSPFEATFPQGV